jgi:hypothetical protein
VPIKVLDVIWIEDNQIKPPGPKMVVCVEPFLGIFLRINSDGWRDGSIAILKKENAFLKHDSYVECGDPFELDEYVQGQALKANGIIGKLDKSIAQEICKAVRACSLITRADKNEICAALGC